MPWARCSTSPQVKVGAKSLGASYLADAPKSTGANRTRNLGEIRPPADLFIGSAEKVGSARTWQRVVALNRTPLGSRGQEARQDKSIPFVRRASEPVLQKRLLLVRFPRHRLE